MNVRANMRLNRFAKIATNTLCPMSSNCKYFIKLNHGSLHFLLYSFSSFSSINLLDVNVKKHIVHRS